MNTSKHYQSPNEYEPKDFTDLRRALKRSARTAKVRRRIIMTIAYIAWYSLWALLTFLFIVLLAPYIKLLVP